MTELLNFEWLAGLSPEAAKGVFLVLFIVIGVLVWRVPDAEVYAGVDEPRWWHNLRIWATGVLAFIFVTYLLF